MSFIELVVGTERGHSTIPLTRAWATILKEDKTVDNLRNICASNGVPWNTVMYAQIEVQDPDNGFSIYNLLDR